MTSRARSSRPELTRLALPGSVARWAAAGFTTAGDRLVLGGVAVELGAERLGWALRGLRPGAELDGLPTERGDGDETLPPAGVAHANGATALDHVVAVTPDFDRTRDALAAAGLDHRGDRDAGGGARQAFFVMGPCLLELAGPADGDVRFWGLTLVTEDIDATAAFLGDRLGPVKDAVQPGRRIATVRREAGLGVPLAFITPRD